MNYSIVRKVQVNGTPATHYARKITAFRNTYRVGDWSSNANKRDWVDHEVASIALQWCTTQSQQGKLADGNYWLETRGL